MVQNTLPLLAADPLKSLLPVTRNPHKEPKCVSSQHVEFSQRISQAELQKCFILDTDLSLSITSADYKAF